MNWLKNISKNLYSRPLVNRDIFYGGSNEGINIKYNISYTASLYDILKIYSYILEKEDNISSLTIASSELYSVDQAIQRMKSMLGAMTEWTNFMNLIPKFGEYFANDEDSYQYLAESIRKHPDQETLKAMVLDAGFEFCEFHNLTGGIVALHKAVKT